MYTSFAQAFAADAPPSSAIVGALSRAGTAVGTARAATAAWLLVGERPHVAQRPLRRWQAATRQGRCWRRRRGEGVWTDAIRCGRGRRAITDMRRWAVACGRVAMSVASDRRPGRGWAAKIPSLSGTPPKAAAFCRFRSPLMTRHRRTVLARIRQSRCSPTMCWIPDYTLEDKHRRIEGRIYLLACSAGAAAAGAEAARRARWAEHRRLRFRLSRQPAGRFRP